MMRWQRNPRCNNGENERVQKLCKEGRLKDALHLVECMVQQSPIQEHPKDAFISLLKECTKRKMLTEGRQIHALIIQRKCGSNIFLSNHLIDMYSKCGSPLDAFLVFKAMPRHNVFSWGAIISAYTDNGKCEEAIDLYKAMQKAGIAPDKIVFVIVLKACARIAALETGKQIHSFIKQKGFHLDKIIQNTLIDMYAKCGCLDDARELFNNMTERDVVSWNTMIAGYAQNGIGTKAITLYEQMKQEGMQADKVTLVCVLKACAKSAALETGKQIHSLVVQKGFHLDVIVQSTLVDMYAKCGCLEDARELFNNMTKRNVVSWNAMIGGYAQNGLGTEAIALYEQMKQEGMHADKVTFMCVLKACARSAALETGKQIYSLILQEGFHLDMVVQSALVDMYAKCGCLEDARKLFNNMTERSVVSWNAMIAGYAQNGLGTEAIALYEQMKQEGMQADKVTFVCVLKACASIGALEQGKQIHSLIVQKGFHLDMILQSTLVDMYAKCGCLNDAREVFNSMTERNVVSWTVMIAGYAEIFGTEAIALYEKMKQEGVEANKFTFACVLKACANIGALEQGKQIHSLIVQKGFHLDTIIQNTLVYMYAKCGCLDHARELFNNMSERNVVSWNVMIAGYAQNGLATESIALYEQMKQEHVEADNITFVCVLNACATTGALEQGKQLHSLIMQKGFHLDTFIENTLVDMYVKCGCLDDARELFNNISKRDVVSWTAMIAGYAQNGIGIEAIALYEQMKQEGIQPNGLTYVGVLSACSHSGLVNEAFCVFDFMCKYTAVIPTPEHYACMVDLLGRAGWFAEANDLITKMPIQPDPVVWTSLLGAAKNAGKVEIGQYAFDYIVKLDPENAAPYLLLMNIYAFVGRMDKVFEMRNYLMDKGLEKMPGYSWIEADNQVHAFIAADESHPQSQQIWAELTRLLISMKKVGYMPEMSSVLEDVTDEEEFALCKHSFKLALVFGLINKPPSVSIRIKKNLHVWCRDCHYATEVISKITGQEIYVMDASRIHHFKDGVCSCGDYS